MQTSSATLNALLRSYSSTQPERTAYLFLSGSPEEEHRESIDFAGLDVAARRVAALLSRAGVDNGDRVLLLCQPGLDYIYGFLGCLYAGVVAVPVYPPRNRHHAARVVSIVEDAGARAILCTPGDLARCDKLLRETDAPDIPLLNLGDAREIRQTAEPPDVSPAQIAFLQYTSGTTGKPKGVMVTQANLMHNLGLIHRWFGSDQQSTMVSWLPPYHDMGLIGGILAPLFGGYRAVLMAPERFVQHPHLWLRAISDHRATVTGAPDFAYRVCCRRVTDEQLATLDLSSLGTTFSGAEPVRASTLTEFAHRFGPAGFDPESFAPCYGLAEGTLLVTGRARQAPLHTVYADLALLQSQQLAIREECDGLQQRETSLGGLREIVSVGIPAGEQRVVVRDPRTGTRCSEDTVGEVCVSGPSVAAGYWRQLERTADAFRSGVEGDAPGEFLRTGDLGFFHRGELYIAGRLKDMIIIAGRNYYSEDIEYTATSVHASLVPNGCAAFSIERDGEEQLVVVAEVERTQRKGDLDGTLQALQEAIWRRHDIAPAAIVLVLAGNVPKTSSGKVRRSECRSRLQHDELSILAQYGEWRGESSAEIGLALTKHTPSPPSGPAIVEPSPPAAAAQDSVERLNDWLKHYARTRIDTRTMDERRTVPPHIVLDFGNQGLFGMSIDESHAGLALPHGQMLRVLSQLGAIDLTLAFFVGLNNSLGILPILRHGQSSLRAELLEPLARGRMLAAFALTEPAAGSNPHAIAATARRLESGHWLVNGRKSWSGSSAWAGVINVFAKQADGAGMVALAVRQGTPGLVIGAEELTMGLRGMIQNTLHLHDARVDDAARLGAAGAGMAIAQETMNVARLGIGAIAVGSMRRCAEIMHRYAGRRTVGTGILLANPLTRQRLGDLRHRIDALDALVTALAIELDAGRSAPSDGLLIAKVLGSEFLSQSTDELMQTLGGRGYIETNYVPQMYRDARIARIFEGPSEVLLSHLGNRLLNHGDDLSGFVETRLGACSLAAELRQLADELAQDALRNSEPLGGATEATQWLHYWLGTIAQWALLLAVVEQAAQQRRIDPATLAWAQHQYESAVETTQRQVNRRRTLASVDVLNDWAASLARDIGPIEQTVPPATTALDPLLRDEIETMRMPAHEHTAVSSEPPGAPPAPSSSGADPALEARLQSWLLQWLGKRTRHRQLTLSPATRFAAIGLDSLLAIELTMAFSDEFGAMLDTSAVWDHATIGELSAHIAEQLSREQVG
jgi:acyl-CoA synthetase (AMP-forming)/AMP-acid ligase II/alkylation response protein AidB-like acyl-CoA dehydrogenase/acyl carrier protein